MPLVCGQGFVPEPGEEGVMPLTRRPPNAIFSSIADYSVTL